MTTSEVFRDSRGRETGHNKAKALGVMVLCPPGLDPVDPSRRWLDPLQEVHGGERNQYSISTVESTRRLRSKRDNLPCYWSGETLGLTRSNLG